MSSNDTASFLQTMMRACWLTAVAYIGYNIILKCTCDTGRFPPPDRGECVSSYQDMLCAECLEPQRECTDGTKWGGDGTERDTCCAACIEEEEEKERLRKVKEQHEKHLQKMREQAERELEDRLRRLEEEKRKRRCEE